MKKTLFLAAALLMIPAMVRAEGCCSVTKAREVVERYLSQLVAGSVTGVALAVKPSLVDVSGKTLGVDHKTLLTAVGAQATHWFVDGKDGWASVPAFLAFAVGLYAGDLGYGALVAKP